jgi:hypothetical protein
LTPRRNQGFGVQIEVGGAAGRRVVPGLVGEPDQEVHIARAQGVDADRRKAQRVDLHVVRSPSVLDGTVVVVDQPEEAQLRIGNPGVALHGPGNAPVVDIVLLPVALAQVEDTGGRTRPEAVEVVIFAEVVGHAQSVIAALGVGPTHRPDQPLGCPLHLQVLPARL